MFSTLCNIWDDFSNWVTLGWDYTVFIIVVAIFAVLGGLAVVSFVKGPKYNKEKKPFKWGSLIFGLVMFGLMAVLLMARFA